MGGLIGLMASDDKGIVERREASAQVELSMA
jgi:hypothetical protein